MLPTSRDVKALSAPTKPSDECKLPKPHSAYRRPLESRRAKRRQTPDRWFNVPSKARPPLITRKWTWGALPQWKQLPLEHSTGGARERCITGLLGHDTAGTWVQRFDVPPERYRPIFQIWLLRPLRSPEARHMRTSEKAEVTSGRGRLARFAQPCDAGQHDRIFRERVSGCSRTHRAVIRPD